MIRAVASLARHRLRARAAGTLLLVGAVAAATALTGTIRALGVSATDAAVGAALEGLDPAARAIRVSGYAPSSTGAEDLDETARAALAGTSGFADAAVRGVILRRASDPSTPYDLQLVAVDDIEAWVEPAEGRAPGACDGERCEALLLSAAPAPEDLPASLRIAGLELQVVGRGTLRSTVPLGDLDTSGPREPPPDATAQLPQAAPAILLVEGVAAAAAAPGASAVGRTYLWTAPLRSADIHPWRVEDLEASLAGLRRELAARAPALTAAAPSEAIRTQLVRGASNDGRLLLVGALGVAILLAFAGYAALLGRRDLRAELDRLTAAGGGRAAAGWLVGLEVIVPTLLGTVIGWLLAVAIAGVAARGAGTDPAGVATTALLAPDSVALGGAVFVAAIVAILAGLVGIVRRETLLGLLPGLAAVIGLVAWRLVSGGGLDAGALGGPVEAPILVAVPVLTGLGVAAVALAIVPRLLRAVAASPRLRPGPAKLALLSLARDAVRPAATVTLLAFGIGGLVFALADAATLRRGMTDQAAFDVGADLRVTEAATGVSLTNSVIPFARYEALGDGVDAWPAAHVTAIAEPAGNVTVLGLPADALGQLRGWRDDLGADASALAAEIAVDGRFEVPGVPLAADATTIEVTVAHEGGDPVRVHAVVVGPDGDSARAFLGMLSPGRETLSAPIPAGLEGGRVIGLVITEGRLVAGSEHVGRLSRATLTFENMAPIAPDGPVEVEASGVTPWILRAPLATDGLVLPAIVGPGLAAAATSPDGTIALDLGARQLARVRPVATLPRFPGLPEVGDGFVVVDLPPLLAALDGAAPGAGRPDEAWLRVDDPSRLDAVREALDAPPFRAAVVRSRDRLEAAAAADPFSGSILAAFAAAGAAGLLLAALGLALGALADLRDESGELRDLEAQGVGPRGLRRQVRARTLVLATAGTAAGVAMGLGLAAVVTSAVGIGADVARPVPPLVLEVPLGGLALAALLPILAAAVLAGVAAAGAFRGSARTRDAA